MNPNDEIRAKILRYFYERNAAATSRFGKRGSAVKISDVKRELKADHGLTQQQAMSNLTYLIDSDWVKSVDQAKTVTVRGGTVPSVVTYYEITASGIDRMEGESEFQMVDRYPGINVTATGTNVITLGDGNIVNAQFSALHGALDELKERVSSSDALDDNEKLDIAADIESIKDQLAKQKPNQSIVKALWTGIERAATAAGLVEGVAGAAALVAKLAA